MNRKSRCGRLCFVPENSGSKVAQLQVTYSLLIYFPQSLQKNGLLERFVQPPSQFIIHNYLAIIRRYRMSWNEVHNLKETINQLIFNSKCYTVQNGYRDNGCLIPQVLQMFINMLTVKLLKS